MKSNKIVTGIIVILILIIIAIFGFLIFYMFEDLQTANVNIVTDIPENNITNEIQLNNEIASNVINNEKIEDPILSEVINPDNTTPQESESFVSTYYYNQLNETAKKIYDGLKANKSKLILGNYVIDYDTKFNSLLNSQNGEEELSEAFQSAWNAFFYDNVDLFYIDVSKMTLTSEYYSLAGIKTYKISIGPGNNENYYNDNFKTKEEVETAMAYLENIKQQMVEQTVKDDIYTKIAKVHNWLIYFVEYEESNSSNIQNTIYGTLKNGKAVCEGYARTFKYFMDAIGVPCVLISGTGQNSQGEIESHAWNDVQIGGNWYAIDVTWDDPIVIGGEQTSEMRRKYFLKGSEEFYKNHTEDGEISENSITFKFPTLSVKDYIK